MPYLPLTYRHAAAPCPTFGGRTGEAFMGIAEAVLPGGRSEAKNTPPHLLDFIVNPCRSDAAVRLCRTHLLLRRAMLLRSRFFVCIQ